MIKHIRGVYNSGIDFGCHRRGVGRKLINLFIKIDGEWKWVKPWLKKSGVWNVACGKVKVDGWWQ